MKEKGREAKTEMKMSRLPSPTWNFLGMNQSILKEEDALRMRRAKWKEPITFSLEGNEEKETFLQFPCENKKEALQKVEIRAREESSLTVWMDIFSQKEDDGFLGLTTNIKAGKNAKVRLIQVQLLGKEYRFADEIKAECDEGAKVELLQLLLGGRKTWAALHEDLDGEGSALETDLGYWCKGHQQMDFNYVVNHKGKQTKSKIIAKGVLEDNAFKLFRGTIDFKKGSAGSSGDEAEEVLMLGAEAVNQTIPLILCQEEDVEGNHGATIGEPEEEILFYLASRGISKEEGTALLARSKIDGIKGQIGNPELEAKVEQYMKEVTENE